jgi:hypothetical protein
MLLRRPRSGRRLRGKVVIGLRVKRASINYGAPTWLKNSGSGCCPIWSDHLLEEVGGRFRKPSPLHRYSQSREQMQ